MHDRQVDEYRWFHRPGNDTGLPGVGDDGGGGPRHADTRGDQRNHRLPVCRDHTQFRAPRSPSQRGLDGDSTERTAGDGDDRQIGKKCEGQRIGQGVGGLLSERDTQFVRLQLVGLEAERGPLGGVGGVEVAETQFDATVADCARDIRLGFELAEADAHGGVGEPEFADQMGKRRLGGARGGAEVHVSAVKPGEFGDGGLRGGHIPEELPGRIHQRSADGCRDQPAADPVEKGRAHFTFEDADGLGQ